RSCNLAVWRHDLDRVDGFEASYTGWGLEDSDLLIRLLRAGVRRKDGNHATGVLHLWHPESDRTSLLQNQQRLDAIERDVRVRALAGLSTLGGTADAARAKAWAGRWPPAPVFSTAPASRGRPIGWRLRSRRRCPGRRARAVS